MWWHTVNAVLCYSSPQRWRLFSLDLLSAALLQRLPAPELTDIWHVYLLNSHSAACAWHFGSALVPVAEHLRCMLTCRSCIQCLWSSVWLFFSHLRETDQMMHFKEEWLLCTKISTFLSSKLGCPGSRTNHLEQTNSVTMTGAPFKKWVPLPAVAAVLSTKIHG